jgi:ABC-2 type transport system permease protein
MNSWLIASGLVKRTIGSPKGLLLYILIPALVISIIIGLMGKEQTGIVNVQYMNHDVGLAGKHLLQELSFNGSYRLTEAKSEEDMREALMNRKAAVSFIIPSGFTDRLLKGEPAVVELNELAMSEASFTLRMGIDQTVSRLAMQAGMLKTAGQPLSGLGTVVEQTERHQVKARLTDFGLYVNPALGVVTGFLLMFMMGLVNTSVSVIVEDRKLRTMTRMFTAPVRSYEIAAGNFLGSFVLGTLQIVVVLAVTKYVMGYRYGLPFGEHLLVLEFFLLAVMGISSAVAGLVRNTENISAVNSIISTPTCMIGGCFWPVSIMPDFMQKLAHFVPQSWTIDAIKSLASGHSLQELWLHFAVLGLLAVVLLGLGSVVLKPSDTDAV